MRHITNYRHFAIAFLTCALVALSPLSAHAQAMEDTICAVVWIIWGPMGTGMAILAVCAVAAAAALGKASWGMALTVIAGIAIMFGASELATALGVGFADYRGGEYCPTTVTLD